MNLRFRLFYPLNGLKGALINFVELKVQQSSNIGKAYVISGGVNKRNVAIILEANATTFLSYDVTLYGTN